MPNIYLLIEGKQEGPFTEDAIRDSLSDGSIPLDLPAWKEGLSTWVRIDALLNWAPKPTINQTFLAEAKLPELSPGTADRASQVSLYRWIVSTPLRIVASIGVLLSGLVGLACTGLVGTVLVEQVRTTSQAPLTLSPSAILGVLKEDTVLSNQYHAAVSNLKEQNLAPDDFCDQQSQIIDRLVTAMKNIDTSGCPNAFRQAYLRHAEAWHDFGDAFASHPHLTGAGEGFASGFLIAALTNDGQSVLDYANESQQQNSNYLARLKDQDQKIRDTWDEVQNAALAYGVKPADYE